MRKYTLFLSILVHVVGAAALFVVPLLALDSLPSVRDRATWIAARAVEPPPPQPPAVGPARAAASLAVPVEAPSGLPPDSDQPADGPGVPSFEPAGGGGDVPGGIGGGGIAIAPPPPPSPAPEARRIVRVGSVLAPPRKIVDVAQQSVIVEVTGDAEKVDGLVELLRPRGILEMVRTGKVAMVRGTAATPDDAAAQATA